MFFDKFYSKKDGVIRGFDMSSRGVCILCVAITVICVLIAVVCLFPIVWVFMASFKDLKEFMRNPTIFPSSFNLDLLKESWNKLHFAKYYLNSLISVAGSVFCAVFFNALLGYVFAVVKPKGWKIAFGLVMGTMMIPATTNMISLYRNINVLHLNGTFLPLWLSAGAKAFDVILFKQYFEGLSKELSEAASLDGCSLMGIFTKVILPLSKPVIAVVAIFAMTGAWSDFLLPYLTLNGTAFETVMVKLFSFSNTAGVQAVEVIRASMFAIIPPTILFLIFQKQITDGATAGAVKG